MINKELERLVVLDKDGFADIIVSDNMLLVDTSLIAGTLVLPNIRVTEAFRDKVGNNQATKAFYVKNIGKTGKSLTIQAAVGNHINGESSITMTASKVVGIVTICSDGSWLLEFSPANPIAITTSSTRLTDAASYVILTPAALTLGESPTTPVTGNVGQLGTPTGTGVLQFISGADIPAPASNAAVADVVAAYATLSALAGTALSAVPLDAQDVGFGAGIYEPGVYTGASAMTTNAEGIVTLDGAGEYVFISTGGAMTTGANTVIKLINGALASQVYWVTAAAITTGANTTFKGTGITPAAITTGANVNLEGRLLSGVAAISIGAGANTIALPSA